MRDAESPATESAARPAARRAPAWWRDWMALTGPLVTLVLMLCGLAARPYRGDEADTISAVRRTVPQLLHLASGFRLAHEWRLAGRATAVWLYTKGPAGGVTPGRAPVL